MEEPSSSCSVRHSHKRKHIDGSSCSDNDTTSKSTRTESDHSESSDSESTVPKWTSEWTKDTLNRLQITSNTLTLFSAYEIISEIIQCYCPLVFKHNGAIITLPESAFMSMVNKCIKMLDIGSSPLKNLDVKDVDEIDSALAYSLIFSKPEFDITSADEPQQSRRLKRKVRSFISGHVESDSHTSVFLKWFRESFYIHGHRFTQQLLNMCLKKKKKPLNEDMFESLFQEFAGMFGLICLARNQQSDTTLIIGGREIASKSDVIFPYFIESDVVDMKVLAVCEVKSTFEEKQYEKNRTCSRSSIDMTKHTKHLDDKLLGQHGGELLLHLPLTEKCALLGIVVQRTNVTFSYLACTETQLENIRLGKPSTNLKINYSRPYNFLKANDRKELMKAFLILGAIQLTPYI